MTIFLVSIIAVVLQRIAELALAKSHSGKMLARGAVEFDRSGYRWIVLMHICFFISMSLEFFLMKRNINGCWFIFAGIFLLAQVLRYWALKSLGVFWNTRIIVIKGSRLVNTGPYRYFRHPNYAAVAAEILSLPLIFSCYITATVFTLLNFVVLRRRLRIETAALRQV